MSDIVAEAVSDLSGLLGSRAVVVLLGDSLTQRGFGRGGWASAISDYYGRRADVLNRGYGGYNTIYGKHVMHALFPKTSDLDTKSKQGKYLLVTVWFGANDASTEDFKAYVPLSVFETNMEDMVRHLQLFFHFIVLLSPPPVHEHTRQAYQRHKYGELDKGTLQQTLERSHEYGMSVKKVAEKYNAIFVDVYALMIEQGENVWPSFVGANDPDGDGLHLSAEGQTFVAKQVIRAIETRTVSLQSIPAELPWGSELDRETFQQTMEAYQIGNENGRIGLGLDYISYTGVNRKSVSQNHFVVIVLIALLAAGFAIIILRFLYVRRHRKVGMGHAANHNK